MLLSDINSQHAAATYEHGQAPRQCYRNQTVLDPPDAMFEEGCSWGLVGIVDTYSKSCCQAPFACECTCFEGVWSPNRMDICVDSTWRYRHVTQLVDTISSRFPVSARPCGGGLFTQRTDPLEGHSHRLNVDWTDSYVEWHCRQTESTSLRNNSYIPCARTVKVVRCGRNVEGRGRESLVLPWQCVDGMESAETLSRNLQSLV